MPNDVHLLEICLWGNLYAVPFVVDELHLTAPADARQPYE
jgi:hypothetical protein